MPADLLDLTRLTPSAMHRAVLSTARPFLVRALGLTTLQRLYQRLPASPPDVFADLALNALRIALRCDDVERGRIPEHGALIVVANHPHGALDGLALLSLVRRVRPDVRLLANHWLAAVPELADMCFFVDPFGGRAAIERSRSGLRSAHLWLRHGGALIVFPSGEVAHRLSGDDTPAESPWSTTAARLARATGAAMVPAHITGRNSALFYRAGRLHPALRTCLLPHELIRKQGTQLRVRVGLPLQSAAFETEMALTDAAALATSDLCGSPDRDLAIAQEIAALPPESCLAQAGDLRVFVARAGEIPLSLQEIGRLRERTFRGVGEGTGTAIDLDAFDLSYLHLFSWDDRARCIVGAYRLGLVDRLVARGGVQTLYTRTLFRYDHTLIDRLGPAIELGRSFVRAEYQRNHTALLLLWRGIGQFVARHPRYRRLFGPVSISARYLDVSQQLLMTFLDQQHRDHELASLVAPTTPPDSRTPTHPHPSLESPALSADEVHRLIATWEPDRKGMPVLLRHYLKLQARVVAFNVDPAFGNALDALMVVDLPSVERPLLNRYFGTAEATHYLAHHPAAGISHAA